MTFKEFIRFAYGLFMGTSTPLLKPAKRYLFRSQKVEWDEGFGLYLGGSCVCGLLRNRTEALVINTNQDRAAAEFRQWVNEKTGSENLTVVLSSLAADFSGGLGVFADAKRILVAAPLERELKIKYGEIAERVEVIATETVLEIAGERVHLIPVGPAATGSDLAVFLENRSVFFAGALYFNRIHPVLHSGFDVERWKERLAFLLDRFHPKWVIPAEGDSGAESGAREFLAYLRDLTDPTVEFATCRSRYDWTEIPGHTSLEENFDLLREKKKTFTTLTRS